MSHDDPRNPTTKPKFLHATKSRPSRREVLQALSALTVAGIGVGVSTRSSAVQAAQWPAIPHGEIIDAALTDPGYKAQLLAKPKQTLAEQHGVALGPDVALLVVEDSLQLVHVVLSTQAGMRGPESGFVAEILAEFRTNAAFRKAVLEDPREVFAEWTGGQIPQQLAIEVVVETPMQRVIQLPVPAAVGTNSIEEVQALWGGSSDWNDWSGDPPVSMSSQSECGCFSIGEWYTHAPQCCPLETQGL